MTCSICGLGPAQGVTVYRANEKGIKGIWRCANHPCKESQQSQMETIDIVQILEGKKVQ